MKSRSRQKQCKKKKSILWTDDVISSNSHKNHIRSVSGHGLESHPSSRWKRRDKHMPGSRRLA